ncbi:hypothetical protein TSUD_02690 [Trifolium subterraneum]|uniref:Pectinesterase inhibitor domain-containing protein n=1 Tax=Trifolium subterraneum TaxID=3900 RepID=A0A2Z6NBZ6_TRISU|nr:hypothetical protein TSUD_02690 [Trifolium subterraneum]
MCKYSVMQQSTKKTCEKSLEKSSTQTSDMKELIIATFNATADELTNQINNSTLYKELATNDMTKQAMEICKEVLGYAVDDVHESINTLDQFDLNGFENTTTHAGQTMTKVLNTSLELSNNAFDIINGVANFVKSLNLSSFTSELNNRKLLSYDDGFPTWASENQRKLLETISKQKLEEENHFELVLFSSFAVLFRLNGDNEYSRDVVVWPAMVMNDDFT